MAVDCQVTCDLLALAVVEGRGCHGLCYDSASQTTIVHFGVFGMDTVKGNMGWIEVVCGPMFCGKSEELIRRLRRAQIARQRVQVFKPAIDNRYGETEIVSHSELRLTAVNISEAGEILEKLDPRTSVIGVDEAQFFGPELVEICERLANLGKRVIVAGLDTDYRGVPFEPVPELMTVAEEVTKLLAICVKCGNPAKHTQRTVQSGERILVGATDAYEARCRLCFDPGVIEPNLFAGKEEDGDEAPVSESKAQP